MQQKNLDYYHQELSYLRKEGQAFANAHPKVAGRLKLGPSHTQDPFVGRLIESFAFLSARVRTKIEDEHNNLTRSILTLLYPHYLLPVPPCSIITFTPNNNAQTFIAKNTTIKSATINQSTCYFNTVYDTTVLPLKLDKLTLNKDIPTSLPKSAKSKACLTMTLTLSDDSLKFSDIDLSNLRFYLNLERHNAFLLYTLLLAHTDSIIVTSDSIKGKTFPLQPTAIKGVGFDDHDALLPHPKHSFSGYRLLTEYFSFVDKFLFVELQGLAPIIDESFGQSVNVHFLLTEYPKELAKSIRPQSMCLNAAPIINLFVNEDMHIDYQQTEFEYHINPHGTDNADNLEVYSVLDVTSSHDMHTAPYFGRKYSAKDKQNTLYWHTNTKSCEEAGIHTRLGTETFMAISETSHVKLPPLANVQLQLKLLCTNRDLTSHLPFGGDEPKLQLVETKATVANITTLCPITKTRYRHVDASHETDLISHITLNQIGFDNADDTLTVLKSILQHYTFDIKTDNDMINQGLLKAEIQTIQKRHPSHMKLGFCKGLAFTLTIDEHYFADHSAYIFGCIVDKFLSKSCSINAFVQLIIHNKNDEELYRWTPQFGSKKSL